jgi:hypothetical protein
MPGPDSCFSVRLKLLAAPAVRWGFVLVFIAEDVISTDFGTKKRE